MLIADRNGMVVSGGWLNPYVTDGLVAMWDGEWNAGGGVHAPNITTWVDLSGNGLNMISKGEPNFGSNYMTSTKVENLWYTDETDLMDGVVANGAFSYEVCAESVIGNSNKMLLVWGGSTPEDGFGVRTSCGDPSRVGMGFRIRDNGSLNEYSDRNTLAVFGSYSDGIDWYIWYHDGLSPEYIKTGGTITSLPIGYYQKRFAIGFRYGYPPDGPLANGEKVYNVRVYNRELTSEEIAHNYAVDAARFNLPSVS